VFIGIPLLAGWTPVCLIVQLTGPRLAWRRFRRQPGFVASLVATAVIVVTITAASVSVWLKLWQPMRTSSPDGFIPAYLMGGVVAGSGVLWSWVTMWLCSVARPAKTWRDRLGRLTGALWIAIGVMSGVYIILIFG
jgi:hypothetical protein